MADRTLLLEIGTEEIPARFLPGAMAALRDLASSSLGEARIGFSEVRTYSTPRRLCLVVEGVKGRQEDIAAEVFGPAKKAAISEDGSYTKAAIGFARSQKVEPEKLVIRTKGKGEYVVAVVEEKGLETASVLPELLKKIIFSLSFPKSMRWADGSMRFVRPIQWVLALFGGDVVPFEIDGIKSGRQSRGHRFLSSGGFEAKDASDYFRLLKEDAVVINKEDRKTIIVEASTTLAAKAGGSVAEDPELLAIVADIVEYPSPVLGGFSDKYLGLPDELLTAVMKGHQKYFSIKGKDGRLTNSFIVVSNTRAENADTVRVGAERVIKARFDDARFYYEEDRRKSLGARLSGLKSVTYQDKLGSLYDKAMRITDIAGALALRICPDKEDLCRRAATLAKADLITGVVREFPELQGVMGKYYALNDGEKPEVAEALFEQYLPAYSGDRLPESEVGAVLGLADRLDSIAAFFSIGLKPTGSEDPFALRRHAISVIAILAGRGYGLSIKECLEPAITALAAVPGSADIAPEVLAFFKQRLEPLLASQGYGYDLIQSVISFSTEVPMAEVFGRLNALSEFKKDEAYNEFLVAIKRVRNILKDAELPEVREELLQSEAERGLLAAASTCRAALKGILGKGDFSGALRETLKLTAPINRFFDEVLVMDKDNAVRENRLALLRDIWAMASSIADFSQLAESGPAH